MTKANLGFALIAKDAQNTLPKCLESIRPYCEQIVVAVDERTTDTTWKIARSFGADCHSVKVADWHECPNHGKVMAQHFANARNESFSHLDPGLDFYGWIDADDILKGGGELDGILKALPPDVVGVWSPYDYATMNGGTVVSTTFHRERLLRASVGWKWEYRVHEVVTPQQPGPWIRADQIVWQHQEGQHRTEDSAIRNDRLLEIDYEEDPNCSRTLFYLGNSKFAQGKWREAIYWYDQLAQMRTSRKDSVNAYEVWQAHCYRSMAYERLFNAELALQAAWDALDCVPGHPEPYFRLASVYSQAGEADKAIFWTNIGRTMPEPPFFVFKNPLDYTFNHRMAMADSLAALGRVTEARQELEQAHATFADARVAEGIEHYKKIEQEADAAQRFKAWASYSLEGPPRNGEIASRYYGLPVEVRGVRSLRDVVMPTILKHRPNTQPHIIFWCGRSLEEWAPPKLNETGIGGSETAVVEIARRFGQAGYRVDVYNGAGAYEGEYGSVGYWDPERYPTGAVADGTVVSWRQPGMVPPARHNVLWCHDLNYGPQPEGAFSGFGFVLGVSAWHAQMLRQYYDLPEDKVDFVPNGINLERFTQNITRKPWQAIYASSPDRGLMQLLVLWRKIAEGEPGAKLLIGYGWDNIDKTIQAGRGDLAEFKRACQTMIKNTPGVEDVGRLPQDKLAQAYQESTVWLYPTSFLEVSCISAMEALASSAIPVTSAAGALPETIGSAGLTISGQPHSFPWQNFFTQTARGILMDPSAQTVYQQAGRDRAKLLTWDRSFERWQQLLARLEAPVRELVAA